MHLELPRHPAIPATAPLPRLLSQEPRQHNDPTDYDVCLPGRYDEHPAKHRCRESVFRDYDDRWRWTDKRDSPRVDGAIDDLLLAATGYDSEEAVLVIHFDTRVESTTVRFDGHWKMQSDSLADVVAVDVVSESGVIARSTAPCVLFAAENDLGMLLLEIAAGLRTGD